MTAHTQVPLGEICKINPRAQRHGYASDTLVSFVPMAAVDERLGAIAIREDRSIADVSKGYTPFQDGDVLFAKITPCMENGKVAIARDLTNGMGSGSTEFYVLRPDGKVLGEYIYHFVRQPQFRETAKRNFTGTAGQQRVPKSFMEDVLIPLPPLAEQRRIISILNRTAKIERLRKQAQERLREFIPALFVKMFGDPTENPMGWEKRKIGEVCVETRQRNPSKEPEKEFRYVDIAGIDNVQKKIDKFHMLLGKNAPSRARKEIRRNDVVLSSVRPNLNAVAMVPEVLDGEIASTGLCVFRADRKLLDPCYLFSYMTSAHFVETVASEVRGANYPAVSDRDIRNIEIILPPLKDQRQFSGIVNAVQSTTKLTDSGHKTTESLTASLMSRLLGDSA